MDLDPRDTLPADPHDVLTEDSEDELADLQKEYEAKKAKLLAEREAKRAKARETVDVQRSPSPERSKDKPPQKKPRLLLNEQVRVHEPVHPKSNEQHQLSSRRKAFHRVPASSFASKLHGIEQEHRPEAQNYNERFFEFENLPKRQIVNCSDKNNKDPYSGEILLRRYYEEAELAKRLQHVKILRAPKLLAKVYAPKFEEPSYVNWCLAGIVMHKSEPKTTSTNSKYLALRVGLFSQTVDVYLFGDAFKKYWKTQCGDVVVILNPTVKKYGNGFSLSLKDDLDSMIEIGTLKNYNRCSAVTQLGERCKYVVDLLKNELCSFHEESKFKQRSRMELQGSVKPKAPRDRNGNVSQMFIGANLKHLLYVAYESAGMLEKDVVYFGGEQFDESKYDRPVVESAAAKIRKQKANQRLQLQLLTRTAPARVGELQKLGIVGEDVGTDDGCKLNLLRMQAFNRGFLKGIGYDPIAEATATSSSDSKMQKRSGALQELKSLSFGKSVSLGPSATEIHVKSVKRKQALRILEKHNSGLTFTPAGSAKHTAPHFQTPRALSQISTDKGSPCEDDSDIEISFQTEEDRSQYETACMQSNSPT